jgi:4-amino-4-deoxy-L-arabinose transferase-like glycosyltransferase
LRGYSGLGWLGFTVGLTLVFGRVAAYNLGNYRPVSNDEVELISVAYKLATRGVVGSDLFVGFFGADQHFFFVLPLQHVLEAISFRIAGVGVAQARWVSLVASVVLVWLTGWLAYRWYGLGTALVCELLLVAWPSNLTAAPNGLPLFTVARVARYDVLAIAFAWLAMALLDLTLRRPKPISAVALGVLCGLAALTTFLGTFVLPLVVLNVLLSRGRYRTLVWIALGMGLVLLPWAVVAVQNAGDLTGQLAVFGARGDFLRPSFYLDNVMSEPSRYRDLLSPALDPDTPNPLAGSWLLAVGVWPALAYLAWRSRTRTKVTGDRILLTSLGVFAGLLVLLDQTKTPLYAIMLFPSLCLALAATLITALRWAWHSGRPIWLPLATSALGLGLAYSVGAEAMRAYDFSATQSAEAGLYLGVGAQIEQSLAPGARILGPERWWWALHDHPYVSLRNVWFQWTAVAATKGTGPPPQFADWVHADNVIVNDNVRGDVLDFPDTVQQQFWAFITTCTQRVAKLNDRTYLDIEVYEIIRPSPRPEVCGPNQ